jgi:peptide/nickel transport system permease protein
MAAPATPTAAAAMAARLSHRARQLVASDLCQRFLHSPGTVAALVLFLAVCAAALFAPWLAPHDTFDVSTLHLENAFRPPVWLIGGDWSYPLGTDDQGRDVLSTIMFGTRTSLVVSVFSILLAGVIGVCVGLISGYAGGRLDAVLMRIADVQLSFPAFLVILLIDGLIRAVLSAYMRDQLAIAVLIAAIGLANWVLIARTVRASTLAERNKEYVQAAHVIGIGRLSILLRHIAPNVLAPVLVISTLELAGAILTESTLSFLGVGVPATQPSLGTIIRIGNNYLLSGQWWLAVFPAFTLVLLTLCINILGDWLRDAINPKMP